MSYLKNFQEKIAQNDYPGFLRLWEEYCYSDEVSCEELRQILQEAKESLLAKAFGQHVHRCLNLWQKITDPIFRHEIIKLIFDIQSTNTEELATLAITYLKEHYPNDSIFEEKLRIIGLKTGDNFQQAISKYELLSHISKGKFVYHTAGWGVGEILDYSLIREDLTLEFDLVMGHKHMSFENALKTLVPLPDDHFLSLRFGNPDLLEKEAKEKPQDIIWKLLKDLGPKTAAEIKEEMCDLIIPVKEWQRWWQTARAKIKKDPRIEAPQSISSPYHLRTITHEQSFINSFKSKSNVTSLLQMVHTHLRDFPGATKKAEFKQALITKLTDLLSFETLSEAEKLQIYFFLEDLSEDKDSASAIEIMQNAPNIQQLINDVHILAFKKRILSFVKKQKKNWIELFSVLIFSLHQPVLRDYILLELQKALPKEEIQKILQTLLKQPSLYPYAYVWYFQKIFTSNKDLPFGDIKGRNKLFEGFMILLDQIGTNPQYRDLSKKMVNMLTKDRYKLFRDILPNTTIEETQEFLLLSTKCNVLSSHDKKAFHSLAEVVFSSLKNHDEKPYEQHVIWTTKEGYEKTRKHLEHLSTVETIQNAKEIEEARGHGDLRENAEYKAALERRSQIQSELMLLSAQFNDAQILTKEDVLTDVAGVGTVVTCITSKGKEKTFTILGPWDADPEKNILSFQSKLAKAICGLKINQSFNFQDETLTISDIKNYFV